jgi:copper transport protein
LARQGRSDDFVLQLTAGDGGLLRAREAIPAVRLPERGIEPLERKAMPGADGYRSVRDVPMRCAGRWHVRVDALGTDFERSRWMAASTFRCPKRVRARLFSPAP